MNLKMQRNVVSCVNSTMQSCTHRSLGQSIREVKIIFLKSWSPRYFMKRKNKVKTHKLHSINDNESFECFTQDDMSEEHACEARLAFLQAISVGQGTTIDLAEAALQISAEDDALVSHSSVQLPTASFQKRLDRLVDELERVVLQDCMNISATNQKILDAIMNYIYRDQKFAPPSTGRSALLGQRMVVEAPGVHEDPKLGYFHELLITKRGIPANLAILVSEVLRRLLINGTIDFVAKIEYRRVMSTQPAATIIPGITRDMAVQYSTNKIPLVLNICSTDPLKECLSYLKRAYWPFAWECGASSLKSDGGDSFGGFGSAARAFLDGADSAEAEAIARTARHRLERGIWTSPGAGDLRRALAATERLVILNSIDNSQDLSEHRRDLAVLYCHAGRFPEAKAELKEYARLRAQKRPVAVNIAPGIGVTATTSSTERLSDALLADRLMTLVSQILAVSSTEFQDPQVRKHSKVAPLNFEEAQRRCREQWAGGSWGGKARKMSLPW